MGTKVKLLVAGLTLSLAGILGIQTSEGTPKKVYQDVVGINTVCTGHVTKLPVGTVVTDSVCQQYLQEDTAIAQAAIKRLVTKPVTQDQYDALTSLVFNIGAGAFAKSTLLRDVNAGQCIKAGEDFLAWDKAGGKPLKGLTLRRRRESTLWLSGC